METLNPDEAGAAPVGLWRAWWNSSPCVISPSSATAAFLLSYLS